MSRCFLHSWESAQGPCPECADTSSSSEALIAKANMDKLNRMYDLLERIASSLDTLVERGNKE